jgi:hypothetical protein
MLRPALLVCKCSVTFAGHADAGFDAVEEDPGATRARRLDHTGSAGDRGEICTDQSV